MILIKMTSEECLPTVLISAGSASSASALIADIISVSNDNANGVSSSEQATVANGDLSEGAQTWCIANKYYTVQVQLLPHIDGASNGSLPQDDIEAHIIYLSDNEEESVWKSRAEVTLPSCEVRLAATQRATPRHRRWAEAAQYELVPLQPDRLDRPDDDDPRAESGLLRLRSALHAHTWRGLRLRQPHAHAHARPADPLAHFGALMASAQAARERASHAPRGQRLQDAEALLDAVCALLRDEPPPSLPSADFP